jgi:hypothetical protein
MPKIDPEPFEANTSLLSNFFILLCLVGLKPAVDNVQAINSKIFKNFSLYCTFIKISFFLGKNVRLLSA